MQSISRSPIARQMIRHYALLTVDGRDLEGIATLVAGGYAFRTDDAAGIRLVAYNSPNLVLLGRVDLVEQAAVTDARR